MSTLRAIAAVRRACLARAGLLAARNSPMARQELPHGGKSDPAAMSMNCEFPNVFQPVKTGTGFAKRPAVENI